MPYTDSYCREASVLLSVCANETASHCPQTDVFLPLIPSELISGQRVTPVTLSMSIKAHLTDCSVDDSDPNLRCYY